MIDLTGQTALICGQPPALAHGIAERLHAAGSETHVISEASPHGADPEAIREAVNAFERLDTVVILPQWMQRGGFMGTTQAEWDAALEQNYEHSVYLTQAAAAHMIARQVAGSILIVSTIAVHMPMLENSAFATSMAALYPLAKMAAVTCGAYGIRVNTLTLGWVETEWSAPYLQTETDRAYIEQGIPLGAVGQPADVGDVCCFLASRLSRYITGALIPVDGGYTLTRSEGTSPYPAINER